MNESRQYRLSNNTKEYLSEFHYILDAMIQGMTEVKLTDSISHNFIVQMIPHHQAAIEMSRNLLKYTTNIPLQDMAQGIITEQTKSIENMRKILCDCSELDNSKRDACLYERRTKQIMETMFSRMGNACANNQIDGNFMREMIPHHEGAIEMSRNALKYDIVSSLKPILKEIITSQEKGIIQMERLLKEMRCE